MTRPGKLLTWGGKKDNTEEEGDSFAYLVPEELPAGLCLVDQAFLTAHEDAALSADVLALEYPVYAYRKMEGDGSAVWGFCVYGAWKQAPGFYVCDKAGQVGETPVPADLSAVMQEPAEPEKTFLYETPEEGSVPFGYFLVDADLVESLPALAQEIWAKTPEEKAPDLKIPAALLELPYPVYLYVDMDEMGRPVAFLYRVYGTWDGVTGFYECDENGLVDAQNPRLCKDETGTFQLFSENQDFVYKTPGQGVEVPYFYEVIDEAFLAAHSDPEGEGYIEGLSADILALDYPVYAFEKFKNGEAFNEWEFRVYGTPDETDEEKLGFYVCDKSGRVDMDHLELRTLELDEAIRGKGKTGSWEPDSAVVSELVLTEAPYTGVAPFDSENPDQGKHTCLSKEELESAAHAGEDCCRYNNILRVGDLMTYSLMATIKLNEGINGTVQAAKYASLKGGKMYIEGIIPEMEDADFVWDTDSFSDIKVETVSEDGKSFTGFYTFSEQEETIPGAAALHVYMKLKSGKNGREVTVTPSFKAWMEGNQYEDDSVTEGKEKYEACELEEPTALLLSAKSAYNVDLRFKGSAITGYPTVANRPEWDGLEDLLIVDGSSYMARVINYTAAVCMEGTDEQKGLLGYENPAGPLGYDLHIRIKDQETGEYVTSKLNPLMIGATGNDVNGLGDHVHTALQPGNDKNGFWDVTSPARNLPLSYSTTVGKNASGNIYNSGYYTLQNGTGVVNAGNRAFDIDESTQIGTIHVDISDYEIKDFPTKNLDGSAISSTKGYISLFQFKIEIPGQNNHQYQVELWDDSMDITSESGVSHSGGTQEVMGGNGALSHTKDTSQTCTTDDRRVTSFKLVQPAYDCSKSNYIQAGNCWTDNAFLGSNVLLYSRYDNGVPTEATKGQTLLNLSKFDGSLYQPIGQFYFDNLTQYYNDAGQVTHEWKNGNQVYDYTRVRWAAKKDGTNWTSYDELEEAQISDLVYYNSIDELRAAGAVCIGVLEESAGENLLNAQSRFSYWVKPVNQTAANILGYDEMVNGGDVENPANIDFRNRTEIANRIVVWRERYSLEELETYLNGGDLGNVVWNGDRFTDAGLWQYEPREYGKGGVIKNAPYKDDTFRAFDFCILGVESKVRMYLDNEKTVYDVSKNESQIPLRIEPSIITQQSVASDPACVENSFTDVTLTVTLPKGLQYMKGSSMRGGVYDQEADETSGGSAMEPEVTVDEKGQYVLTWVYKDAHYGQELEPLHYRVEVDPLLESGANFTVSVTISCQEDRRPVNKVKTANNCRYWDAGFQVMFSAETRLHETNKQNYVDVAEELGFNLIYANASSIEERPNMRIYSLLPQNGDWRGSHFSGDYSLADILVEVTNGNATGLQLYYTTDRTLAGAESEDAFCNMACQEAVEWIPVGSKLEGDYTPEDGTMLLAAAGTIPKNATAICLYSEKMGYSARCRLELNLQPHGNQVYDVYANSGFTRSDNWSIGENGPVKVVSAATKITVLQRVLSGLVFIDADHDGIRSETDETVAGAVVSLEVLNEKTNTFEPATDVTGKTLEAVVTGADGGYEFVNLQKGKYRVKVESDLLPFMEVTKYQQGNDRTLDSDATEETTDQARSDRFAWIENIGLPLSSEITIQRYEEKNMDVGLWSESLGEITVVKKLVTAAESGIRKEDETFRIGLYDGTGKKKLAEDVLSYDAATDSYLKKNEDGSFEPLIFKNLQAGAYVVKELDALGNAIEGSGIYYEKPAGGTAVGKYETDITPARVVLDVTKKQQTVKVTNREPEPCLLALEKQVTGDTDDAAAQSFTATVTGRFYQVGQDGKVNKSVTKKETKEVTFIRQADGTYAATGADLTQYSVLKTQTGEPTGAKETVPGLILGETYSIREVLDGIEPYAFASMEIIGNSGSKVTVNGLKVTAAKKQQTVLITNIAVPEEEVLGSLKIKKKILGTDDGETFRFDIVGRMPEKVLVQGKEVDTLLQKDGSRKLTVELTAQDRKQGVTVSGLTVEELLTVTEQRANAEKYKPNTEKFDVKIREKTVEVTFTNERVPEEPDEPVPQTPEEPSGPKPEDPVDPSTPKRTPDPQPTPDPVPQNDPLVPDRPLSLRELISEPVPLAAMARKLGMRLVEILDEEVPLAGFLIKTGDAGNSAGYLGLLLAALAALTATCITRKKEEK